MALASFPATVPQSRGRLDPRREREIFPARDILGTAQHRPPVGRDYTRGADPDPRKTSPDPAAYARQASMPFTICSSTASAPSAAREPCSPLKRIRPDAATTAYFTEVPPRSIPAAWRSIVRPVPPRSATTSPTVRHAGVPVRNSNPSHAAPRYRPCGVRHRRPPRAAPASNWIASESHPRRKCARAPSSRLIDRVLVTLAVELRHKPRRARSRDVEHHALHRRGHHVGVLRRVEVQRHMSRIAPTTRLTRVWNSVSPGCGEVKAAPRKQVCRSVISLRSTAGLPSSERTLPRGSSRS